MHIMKLAGGIVGSVLVKMDQRVIQQQKCYNPLKGNKITRRQMQIYSKGCTAVAHPWAHTNL